MSTNHKDWKFIFEKFEKPVSGIAGTIRTIPENYWVATVKSDGKIVFDSFEGMVKDIDKDTVQKLWDDNKIEEKEKKLFEKGGKISDIQSVMDKHKQQCLLYYPNGKMAFINGLYGIMVDGEFENTKYIGNDYFEVNGVIYKDDGIGGERKTKLKMGNGGRVYPVENERNKVIPAGMIVVVKDTEDEANNYIKDKNGLRVEQMGDKWAIKTFASGGALSTSESMLYGIQNHISSGYIGGRIYDLGYQDGLQYKVIEKVRHQMILILQEHGDETYSIANLNKLIADAASIVLGKKDMQSRSVDATHFDDGGRIDDATDDADSNGKVKIKWSRVNTNNGPLLSLPAAVSKRLTFSVYPYRSASKTLIGIKYPAGDYNEYVVAYKYWDYPMGFVPKIFKTFEEAKADCEERAAYFKNGGKIPSKFSHVMSEFKKGTLTDDADNKITSRGQAIAIAFGQSSEGKYEAGGETASTVNVKLDGYDWVLNKIDHTHFSMAMANSDARPFPYHVGQFKDHDSMEFYNDLVKWLDGKLDINGNEYKTRYAAGGSIPNNYEDKMDDEVWEAWTVEQKTHFLADHADKFKTAKFDKYETDAPMSFARVAKMYSYRELPHIVRMVLREHIVEGQYAAGGETGKKLYYEMDNIGKAKYTVNFYDGVDTHTDGSPFYGIRTFQNKEKRDKFIDELKADGYAYRYADGGMTEAEKERIARRTLPDKYYEKFTLKGNGRSQYSIFSGHDDRQAVKKLFPSMSIPEHKKLAEKYYKEHLVADEQYSKTLDTEFEKLFGRKYQASDYKISGIARDEFSDEVKNRLRELIGKGNAYEKAYELHNSVLPAKDKVKKLASGGHIGFAGLEKKVAKEYAGKSVADKYKKQYGSTYDTDEAKEVAAKVAGKVKKQQASRNATPAKKGAKKTQPSLASKYK